MSRVLTALLLLLFPLAALAEDTPRYVIYYNSEASPAEDLIGLPYSHVILSFVTLPAGGAQGLSLVVAPRLDAPLKIVEKLQADGKKVLISFGGGEMKLEAYRPAVGQEAALAKLLAAFVAKHGLDGVDLDFEATGALRHPRQDGAFDGKAFLIALSRELRKTLPAGKLITHAPQAPYLDPSWHKGPYLEILQQAGADIDWITVQYYNNPDFDLPVKSHLVGAERDPFPASYTGIVGGAIGFTWPSEKTLVGLPVYAADASNGHQPPKVVRDAILKPLVARYGAKFGGLTGWQFSTLTADHRYWNEKLAGALRE
ncbi:MAG: glycoside hydrolase family 18 protein [Rhodovibrionaceae bacterium]